MVPMAFSDTNPPTYGVVLLPDHKPAGSYKVSTLSYFVPQEGGMLTVSEFRNGAIRNKLYRVITPPPCIAFRRLLPCSARYCFRFALEIGGVRSW